jgi:sodium/hydrogen exchanger-like protein 6/7
VTANTYLPGSCTLPAAIFSFWGIFLGSIVLGVALGLAAAALLRSRWYHGEINLETGLMLLLGYASYMAGTAAGGCASCSFCWVHELGLLLSMQLVLIGYRCHPQLPPHNQQTALYPTCGCCAAGLSGIVSVMFCAMVCGAYCAPNLSPGGLQASKGVYAVLASCMETFVFVYIGVTLFMEPQGWHCVKFTVGGGMAERELHSEEEVEKGTCRSSTTEVLLLAC